MEEKEESIIHLQKTNRLLSRAVSPSFQFYLSIIRGVGTAIGITIVGGILLGVFDKFIQSAYDIPFIGKILQTQFQ
jgi:preprotein translocase subunit Sss1